MKSSELFTVCATFGLEASCLCIVLAKRITSEYIDKSKYDEGMSNIMMIIKHSIENSFFV